MLDAASPLAQVLSIEKMEDTSLLPSPVIVSVRGQMAFQFIELKDRDALMEALLSRLWLVQADHPVHHSTSQGHNRVHPLAVGPRSRPLVPSCWAMVSRGSSSSSISHPWGPVRLWALWLSASLTFLGPVLSWRVGSRGGL